MIRSESYGKAHVVYFCWVLAEEMEKYQLNYLQTFGDIIEHEKTVHEIFFWEIMNGIDDKIINEKTARFCKENEIMDNPTFFLTHTEILKNLNDRDYLKIWFLEHCEKIYQNSSLINELKMISI